MSTTQRITQVDAFADRPYSGNPAAVCLLPAARDEAWMQAVAAEMNLSETAFLVRGADAAFDLRWFTPAVEVDLCGHATLASAHVLWEEGHIAPDALARFHTKSGLLTARRAGELIELDFPVKDAEPIGTQPPDLGPALGATVLELHKNRFDYLALVESEEIVRALRPDIAALVSLPVRGVIVTSRASSPDCDYVSRFFAPAAGVDEDPVTGSAHCFLAPFWAARLGRPDLVGYQASARGGVVRTRVEGERVKLAGRAITMLRGELLH